MHQRVEDVITAIGLGPRAGAAARFADGAAWHVEIPSVEGPEALQAVIEEMAALDVPIHRVSQGSGVAFLRDHELAEMAALGRESALRSCSGPGSCGRAGISRPWRGPPAGRRLLPPCVAAPGSPWGSRRRFAPRMRASTVYSSPMPACSGRSVAPGSGHSYRPASC